MNLSRGPIVWGILLVVGGLILLAENLGWFGGLSTPIWTILFALGSLAFFGAFFTQRGAWWFLIPAFILAGLAVTVLVGGGGEEGTGVRGDLAGGIFLWSVALAFWAVYLADQRQWWAIIPAGVMTTLGIIPVVAGQIGGLSIAAVLFLGIGLTFGLLYLLRAQHRTGWAIFPAAACLGVALVMGVFGTFVQFWPVIFLILPGLYLLYLAFRPRGSSPPKIEGGPTA
jgi:hypothetical protein